MAEKVRQQIILDGTEIADDDVWWTKPEEEIGYTMVNVAKRYETAMQTRREQSRRYVQLFKGQILPTSMYDAAAPRQFHEDIWPVWNVVQRAINTAKSIVCKNRVRVAIQTDGADYELQEAAKLAELWVAGIWRGNKVYEELDQRTFVDAAAPGLGITLVEPHEETFNVEAERVIPDELIYSEFEAIDPRKLQQLFRVKWWSKWAALKRFGDTPARQQAISSVTAYELMMPGIVDRHIPIIPIYTGWFLPSSPGADDGRRVVAVAGDTEGCTLRYRKWEHNRFPLAFFRVEDSPAGLWGISMAERLAGYQYRLNELNWLIEESARLGSLGKWFVDTASSVSPAQLNNQQGGIIHYTGTAPKFEALDGIPRDLKDERTTTKDEALQEVGLSEWTVGGVQPQNIESGEGLRALREQEQGRALPAGQNWEAYHVELAEISIMAGLDAWKLYEEAKEATKDKKDAPKLRPPDAIIDDPDGYGARRIQFEKIVKLLQDSDAWTAAPFPTSILPTTPTGKFEKLREWRKDGTIDEATFAALSEMPDLNQQSSLSLAGLKSVRRAISRIVTEGETAYTPPDPAMPLELGIKIAQATYLKGLDQGMPETKLALLLSWIDDARDLLNPPNPAAALPQPLPGPQPSGAAPSTPLPPPVPGEPLPGAPGAAPEALPGGPAPSPEVVAPAAATGPVGAV